MSGTPGVMVTVASARVSKRGASEQLLDALRRLWSRATAPQRDEHVQSIAKGLFTSQRFKGVEHVVALQFDALDREAPFELAEEFWQTGLAITRAKRAELRGIDEFAGLTLGDLLTAERRAHAEREIALAIWLEDKTNYRKAVAQCDADAVYLQANDRLRAYLARRRAEAIGPRLAVCRAD